MSFLNQELMPRHKSRGRQNWRRNVRGTSGGVTYPNSTTIPEPRLPEEPHIEQHDESVEHDKEVVVEASDNVVGRISDNDASRAEHKVCDHHDDDGGYIDQSSLHVEDGDDNHRYEQKSTKKRKALYDVDDTDARLNSGGNASKAPKIDSQTPASASKAIAQLAVQATQTTHPESHSSKRRNVIKYWPQIQEADAFTNATIGGQRAEIKKYMGELQAYALMIQAGAIPTHFVAKLFRRLGTHFQHLDNAQDRLVALQSKQVEREAQILALLQESTTDNQEEADLHNGMIEDDVQEL